MPGRSYYLVPFAICRREARNVTEDTVERPELLFPCWPRTDMDCSPYHVMSCYALSCPAPS